MIKRCKGQKPYCQEHVDRLEKPEENMSTGLVREGSSSTQRTAMRGMNSAQRVNQSTGSRCSRLDNATCRLDEIAVEKPVDWFEAESSAKKLQPPQEQRNLEIQRSPTKKFRSPNPEGILQCGKQQSCSQQAKEQISIKITEIQQLVLQISWKNRGSEQLRTVMVFRL